MIKIDLGISVQEMRFIISEADSNETGVVDYHEFVPLAVDLVQVGSMVFFWVLQFNIRRTYFHFLSHSELETKRRISVVKKNICSMSKYWSQFHTKIFSEPLNCACKRFTKSMPNAMASFVLPTWRSVWWHSLGRLVSLRVKSSCSVSWFPKTSSDAANTTQLVLPFSILWARCASWRWRTPS